MLAASPGASSRAGSCSTAVGRLRLPRPAHDRRPHAPSAREDRARTRASRSTSSPCAASATASGTDEDAARIRASGVGSGSCSSSSSPARSAIVYLVVVPPLENRLVNTKIERAQGRAHRRPAEGQPRRHDSAWPDVSAAALELARVVDLAPRATPHVPIALRLAPSGRRRRARPDRARGRRDRAAAARHGRARAAASSPRSASPVARPSTVSSRRRSSTRSRTCISSAAAALAGAVALAVRARRRLARSPRSPAGSGGSSGGRTHRRRATSRAGRRRGPRRGGRARASLRPHARPARGPRPRAPGVHRQRLARATDAALRARRLPRAARRRGPRRGDAARLPRDDARPGRAPDEARDRPARPLAARRRPAAGRPEPVDLGAAAQARGRVRRASRRRAGHGSRWSPRAGEALGDEQRVLQIVRSLVENAIRTRRRGRGGRACGATRARVLSVETTARDPGGGAEHLFERFYRGEGEGGFRERDRARDRTRARDAHGRHDRARSRSRRHGLPRRARHGPHRRQTADGSSRFHVKTRPVTT